MPIFDEPLHGVSLSEALKEAAVIAPVHRTVLYTFELRHASLDEPVRVVLNHEPITATLEVTAPVDAGIAVEFLAARVQVGRPEESESASSPTVTLTITNVSGLISEALRQARGSLELWEVTERVYTSDDLTCPAILPPLTLTVSSFEYDGVSATLTCSFGDSINVSVPRATFTPEQYPGLTAR